VASDGKSLNFDKLVSFENISIFEKFFMQVFHFKRELVDYLNSLRNLNKTIGLVPTMGALHHGHLSLLSYSLRENDITLATVFVNPAQFNDKNDLLNYPRTLENDIDMLARAKCDLVFCPEADEMYPEPDCRVFDFGTIGNIMEGLLRPGHFNGVAQIVTKFFDLIKPDKAYFGEKDFQQLAIIKYLVQKFSYPVDIIACPIIREPDGLAMSSRNRLLSIEQRKRAPLISLTLFEAVKKKNQLNVEEIKKWVVEKINSDSNFKTEYFEIVDDMHLKPISAWNDRSKKVGCIAVRVGNIRLIDNVRFD
jgi:pantoate--beta-alanine ligase